MSSNFLSLKKKTICLNQLFSSYDGFSCSNCGKKYMHRGNLGRHLKYECGTPGRFSCTICNRRFSQACNLRRHAATQHLNYKKKKF